MLRPQAMKARHSQRPLHKAGMSMAIWAGMCCVVLLFPTAMAGQSVKRPFDRWFPTMTVEHVEVCPQPGSGPRIAGDELPLLAENERSDSYQPMAAIFLDKARQYKAYLLVATDLQSVAMFVFAPDAQRPFWGMAVAAHEHLAGAYQSWLRCWIVDCNGDAVLDLLLEKDLIDYELEMDGAPNVSGTDWYGFSLQGGEMAWIRWPQGWEETRTCAW